MLSKLLTRREQLVLLALAGSLLVGSATLYTYRAAARPETAQALTVESARIEAHPEARRENVRPVEAKAPAAEAKAPAAETPDVVAVSVRGAVALPGVYEFSPGARVQEALDRAGGALDAADLGDVNLAARLMDGTTLTVPEAPAAQGRFAPGLQAATVNPPAYTVSGWRPMAAEALADPAQGAAVAPGGASLDLNAASETELQALPGIGPKLASQIAQYRASAPFTRVEDLLNVSGIGPKRLESIRPFVSVR